MVCGRKEDVCLLRNESHEDSSIRTVLTIKAPPLKLSLGLRSFGIISD